MGQPVPLIKVTADCGSRLEGVHPKVLSTVDDGYRETIFLDGVGAAYEANGRRRFVAERVGLGR